MLIAAGTNIAVYGWIARALGFDSMIGYLVAGASMAAAAGGRGNDLTYLINTPGRAVVCALDARQVEPLEELEPEAEGPIP
jgi:hypothetical protein